MPLLAVHMNNHITGIHLYKRKAISIWNYLANICALGLTIYSGLSEVFRYIYSKNFDNYKIKEKIFSIINERNLRIDSDDKDIKKSFESLGDKNLELNLIKKNNNNDDDPTNDDNKLENEIIANNKEEKEEIENNGIIEDNFKLPKLKFYSVLFNNIYCKCCCFLQKQKLIDACNKVSFRYLSIENILYNQLKFENLMKDYKWNNPNLKSINVHKYINEIKKYS